MEQIKKNKRWWVKVNINSKNKNLENVRKDVKWYSYVEPYLDAKLKNFMEGFKINNQARLIRTFVDNALIT